jgi:hypothetical protein
MRSGRTYKYLLFSLLALIGIGGWIGLPEVTSPGTGNSAIVVLHSSSITEQESREAPEVERSGASVQYSSVVKTRSAGKQRSGSSGYNNSERSGSVLQILAYHFPSEPVQQAVHIPLFYRLLLFPKHSFW